MSGPVTKMSGTAVLSYNLQVSCELYFMYIRSYIKSLHTVVRYHSSWQKTDLRKLILMNITNLYIKMEVCKTRMF